MTQSKNGQWIIDNPNFQYIIEERDILEIFKIKMYSYGFNSVSIIYEMNNGKVTETTYPRNYFNRYTFPNIQSAMLQFITYYTNRNISSADIDQRMFEYHDYIIKKFPEILI